jgi:2-polyprenyl-3-methyl-5-hydroxy-6-metoxy-1,4-benzoquinol methylase
MFVKAGKLQQEEYNGIQEMAAYGLHRGVFNMLKPYLKPGMKVLDFGCGKGAFSQRLIDAGMTVHACDIDTDQIMAKVSKKIKLDLNGSDITQIITEKYDVVIAMEIIEHLQNPWKYMDDCIKILNPGGLIVFSTPNVSNFVSRMRFLMRGTITAFEKNDLAHGHITPLTFVQLENMFSTFGLKIIAKGHAGDIPVFHFHGFSTFVLFRNTLLPLLYPFMSGPKRGRALVYILRKNG